MSKDMLVKDLMILILSESQIQKDELERKLSNLLDEYSITKLQTTLPSTGDGSTTKYLFETFTKDKLVAGVKKSTLEQYLLAVQKFYIFLGKEVTLATKDDIVNYLNYYRYSNGKGEQKPNTVKNRYNQLSSFYSWLFANKYIAENPFLSIQSPKGTLKTKEIISVGEIEKMTISCEESKKGIKLARDLAVITFMYESGVRAGELVNIKISDVNLEKRTAIIRHGKGDKSRIVPFGDKTKVRLINYLSFRKFENDDYLFVHYYKNKKLTVSGLERSVSNIGKKSEITRIHPHLFRASYATNLIQKGVSPSVVKTILGHSNLMTLESYVQITDKDINKISDCY